MNYEIDFTKEISRWFLKDIVIPIQHLAKTRKVLLSHNFTIVGIFLTLVDMEIRLLLKCLLLFRSFREYKISPGKFLRATHFKVTSFKRSYLWRVHHVITLHTGLQRSFRKKIF